MAKFEGENLGAVLAGILRAFASQPAIIARILQRHHLDHIDPEEWYPMHVVAAIYADLRDQAGARALYLAGLKVVAKVTDVPVGADLKAVLPIIHQRYRLFTRGPRVGAIECSFDEDHGAVMIFSTPFVCAVTRGILSGYCDRCNTPALIEHGASGCVDSGADACVYRVSW